MALSHKELCCTNYTRMADLDELISGVGLHCRANSTTMWDLMFYLSAVTTYILLFWFYKPKEEDSISNSTPKKDREGK